MTFLRPAFLLFFVILISNVISYQDADNYENLAEENICYDLQDSYGYSLAEEYVNFSEELQDEKMSVVELPLQDYTDTLKTDAKCYIEPRNSESLKKILSSTCAPNEEKQL